MSEVHEAAPRSRTRPELPVPWIARWTAERDALPVIRVDEVMGFTILRQVEPKRRKGEALFGEVHSGRAWQAVVESRCQVCGRQTERPLVRDPWPVLEGATAPTITEADIGEGFVLTEQPTCPECVNAALRLCPHLAERDDWSWWEVTDVEVSGGTMGIVGRRQDVNWHASDSPPPAFKDPETGKLTIAVMKQPFMAFTIVGRYHPEET